MAFHLVLYSRLTMLILTWMVSVCCVICHVRQCRNSSVLSVIFAVLRHCVQDWPISLDSPTSDSAMIHLVFRILSAATHCIGPQLSLLYQRCQDLTVWQFAYVVASISGLALRSHYDWRPIRRSPAPDSSCISRLISYAGISAMRYSWVVGAPLEFFEVKRVFTKSSLVLSFI